jgi:hypothetical protein
MIEDILKARYGEYLDGLDIYENKTSLILSRIVVKDEFRGTGIGSKIMEELTNYANKNNQIVALTPSGDFGGNKNRLIQFYKSFGFKHNKGQYKHFGFRDSMIRYPRMNETMKPIIKNLLREGLLLEVDNRQKIIKFSGNPKLADLAHEISNKYSVWVANQMIDYNLLPNANNIEQIKDKFLEVIDIFKIQNRPSINLNTLDLSQAITLKNKYQYISDWINNPNVPYEDLSKLTWEEAERKSKEWHESLKSGEVTNILDDESEILHKFSDGYMWVLTKEQYCSASEESMGHCGTATKSDMYLLRLIKGNEEFVTMDWHPTHKYIIQIKGKQNTKPVPKYYPYIIYILQQPNLVHDLRMDEGYRPETNLQLEDFSVEQGKEILDNNYYLLKDERSIAGLFYQCEEPYNLILMIGEEMEMVVDDNQVISEIFQKTKFPNKTLETLNSLVGFTIYDFQEVFDGFDLENMINNSTNKKEMRELLFQPTMNESIKNLLREGLLTHKEVDVKKVADFVNFAKKYLGIDDDIKIALAFERTPDIKTTAYYNYGEDNLIKVYVKNRAIIDVCRSIAHELVHHMQFLEGRLLDAIKDGEDGSPIENEANSVAGIIIRKWGKLHPEIYI